MKKESDTLTPADVVWMASACPAANEVVFPRLVAGDRCVDRGAGIREWPSVDIAEKIAGVGRFESLENVLAVGICAEQARGVRGLIVEQGGCLAVNSVGERGKNVVRLSMHR